MSPFGFMGCAKKNYMMFPAEKSAFFIQNWEEIDSLKNGKSSGIVLEKSWNSVFPFLYEPCISVLNGR